jgi:hypothetical protein
MGPGGGLVDQQGVPDETGVPLAALGVEDAEGRPAPRRTVAVVRDERLGALADDVAAEADPRAARQLEPDPGRLGDRGREAAGESRGVEDQQQRLGATGECRESMESIGDPRGSVGPGQPTAGQVEDEQVDRSTSQEAPRDAQALVEAGRGDDHEPLEADAAGDRLDGVKAARQVEPGDDRPGSLGLGGDAQAEGRPAAGSLPADGDTGRLREPARTEDGIERSEPGADDPVVGPWVEGRSGVGYVQDLGRDRRQGQCPDDPRSCGTPAGPEARDSGVHITPTGRHETAILEQMF